MVFVLLHVNNIQVSTSGSKGGNLRQKLFSHIFKHGWWPTGRQHGGDARRGLGQKPDTHKRWWSIWRVFMKPSNFFRAFSQSHISSQTQFLCLHSIWWETLRETWSKHNLHEQGTCFNAASVLYTIADSLDLILKPSLILSPRLSLTET